MVADKCERYEISHVPAGLHVSLWQALPNVGFGVIALVILAACFVTDPYPGHGRMWLGLGTVALMLVALFGVRIENWTISHSAIKYRRSLWNKEVTVERPPDTPLRLRLAVVACVPDGTQPPFPHVVHVVGPGGTELGDGFRFRQRSNLEQFLETLRTVLPIDVEELRSGMEDAIEPGMPPSDMADSSPE